MQNQYQKEEYSLEVVKQNSPLRRLMNLKGKIWALTLQQAERYEELASFVCPISLKEKQELQKIRLHLRKRIDKLTKREEFEKEEFKQKMKLQILDRELQHVRTSIIDVTNRKSRRNSPSIATLKQLDSLLGALHNSKVEHIPTQVLFESMSIEEKRHGEIKQQSQQYLTTPQKIQIGTYKSLYSHIEEIQSMENTQLSIISFDENQPEIKKRLSPRRRVYRNFIKKTKEYFGGNIEKRN